MGPNGRILRQFSHVFLATAENAKDILHRRMAIKMAIKKDAANFRYCPRDCLNFAHKCRCTLKNRAFEGIAAFAGAAFVVAASGAC